MGKGIDLARLSDPDAKHLHDLLENMRDQLLIVFLKKLGGKITVPVSEVDDTGMDIMKMFLDQDTKAFTFEIHKKQ